MTIGFLSSALALVILVWPVLAADYLLVGGVTLKGDEVQASFTKPGFDTVDECRRHNDGFRLEAAKDILKVVHGDRPEATSVVIDEYDAVCRDATYARPSAWRRLIGARVSYDSTARVKATLRRDA